MHNVVNGSLKGDVAGQLLLLPFVQSALHPSPSTLLPSSHCSAPATIESLQVVVQTPLVR